MRKVLLMISLIVPNLCLAQSASNMNKVWIQGDFILFSTIFNLNGVENEIYDTTALLSQRFIDLRGGHSNICDSFGNVLLISDGLNLYDKNLDYVEDGDTLTPYLDFYHDSYGSNRMTQASIILPFKKRSEEHTSELQSRENLVCRLLLEKKKKKLEKVEY